MRQLLLLLIFSGWGISLYAQQSNALSEGFAAIEKRKSQNRLDAFASFYQIALKHLDPNTKSIDLNGSLFSLYYAHDKARVQQYSESQIRFLRNLNLNAKINLDDNYNYQGYAVGVHWALVNARDTRFLNLEKDSLFQVYDALLVAVVRDALLPLEDAILADSLPPDQEQLRFQKLQTLSNQVLRDELDAVRNDPLGVQVLALCDQYIRDSAPLQALGFTSVRDVVRKRKERYRQLIAATEKLPFWSLNPYAKTDASGRFNQGVLESILLLSGPKGELDFRAKYAYADTLATGVREQIRLRVGYNFKWGTTPDATSLFEVKFSGAYDRVLRGPLWVDEERELLSAVADLKLRLSPSLILPLTLQYDPKKGQLFGFINITYNLNLNP